MNAAKDWLGETLLCNVSWDDPSLDRRSWGEGEWLNEPDKVQFTSLEGYRCLALRNHITGSWCGYVEITRNHPAYGLSYNGIDNLLEEVSHAQFHEVLYKWHETGHKGLPPTDSLIELPDPSEVGKAIASIRVHGGLTFGDSPSRISPGMWQHIRSQFEKAREKAKQYPIGDAAIWLHKWQAAEHDCEAFKAIANATCICFEPPDDDGWLFGFDTLHAFDLMPAIQALLKSIQFDAADSRLQDVYRNLAYVQGECLSLANQLKEIELKFPKNRADAKQLRKE